jgi:DNA-binding transcriptional LysR family regulator
MNFETLRLYCDIVRLRSFSNGASANELSQSAASQAIQQLEGELDVRLLDRARRPFTITTEGRVFYDASREILERYEQVKARLSSARTRFDGTVRVAAIYSVGLHDLSRHLQPFMLAHPQAKVRLDCLHPNKVVEAVINDEADIGIMSYPPATRSLSVIPWRSEQMVLVCRPGHRLAKRRTVAPHDLNGETFVAFDPHLGIRKAIDRSLKQRNVRVNVVMEFDNIETIKQAIAIDAGISILPRDTVLKEVELGSLAAVPVSIPNLVRPVGIIYRKGKQLSPTVARFIESLRQSEKGARD